MQHTTETQIEGLITKTSPYTLTETLQRVLAEIQKRPLTLFAQVNHTEGAQQAGLTMQEAHVIIFGSPKAGTPLMVASPLLALDLPLKILVWQDSNGQVQLSYNSTYYLAQRYHIPQELQANIAAIDMITDNVVSQ